MAVESEQLVITPEQVDTTRPTSFYFEKDEESEGKELAVAMCEENSPTAEEVSLFMNEKSAYIEDVFKCMLRGISNSKLSMVKNGLRAPPSILQLQEDEKENINEEEEEDVLLLPHSISEPMNPEMKILQLVHNLDYFIDIVCSIKSSDAKDTYSIILLYEKLIFDLKAEITSLSKSLKIYQTILGKKKLEGM